jgi:hypothetical protein
MWTIIIDAFAVVGGVVATVGGVVSGILPDLHERPRPLGRGGCQFLWYLNRNCSPP